MCTEVIVAAKANHGLVLKALPEAVSASSAGRLSAIALNLPIVVNEAIHKTTATAQLETNNPIAWLLPA